MVRKRVCVVAGAASILLGLGGPASATAQRPAAPAAAEEVVRLVTGDVLLYRREASGRQTVTPVDPSPDAVGLHTYVRDGDLHAVPLDVLALVGRERVDERLFNVTGLVEQGLTGRDRALPLIVEARPAASRALESVDVRRELESIGAVAVRQPAGRSERFWADVTKEARPDRAALVAGISRIWLDGRVEAALDSSAPVVGAPEAWERGFDGAGVDVAVLDTGIDAQHADVAENIEATRNFTGDADAVDRTGHGTHVAGIVAGTGAASGGTYRGIAPAADLLVGKVLADDGLGRDSWVIDGMEWAVASGAEVVNLSLGGNATDGSDPVSRALDRLREESGALFVVAAGNDGPTGRTISAPAAADGALSVGNATDAGELEFSSSRGPRLGDDAVKPELVAPGTDVIAAKAAAGWLGFPVGEFHVSLSGTSMAAPHVAGAAALLLQAHPDWKADELEAALVSSARTLDGLTVYEQGAGMLAIPAALDQRLRVDTPVLDLGSFARPYDEPALVVTRELTYVNTGDAPLTADLAADVRNEDGTQATGAELSVEPARLEVAPGQAATVTVRLDARTLPPGNYGGAITATPPSGPATRTVTGFYKQGATADLTVRALDRRGGRPTPGWSCTATGARGARSTPTSRSASPATSGRSGCRSTATASPR